MKKVSATGTKCICIICLNHFVSRRGVPLYCSKACSQKAYRQRHGQPLTREDAQVRLNRRELVRHCSNCTRIFYWSGVGRKPKFCGNACRVSYDQRKQAAAYRWQNEQIKTGNAHEFVKPANWWAAKPSVRYEFIERSGFDYVHSANRFVPRSERLF